MSMTSKILLIFCDGTGTDGNLAVGPKTIKDLSGTEGSNAQQPTNALRLSRAVQNKTTDGRLQIVFYQSGVGSEADFNGNLVPQVTCLQVYGAAVASKIRDAYAFIAQNFDEGDEVCIFGFSRGAYTARKLSGLIDKIGLLERENLGYFFEIWKDLADNKTPAIPPGTRTIKIKCVGVYDTVGSIFNYTDFSPLLDALSIKDTSLPAPVEIALHAVAMHENREKFLATLWAKPDDSNSSQVFKQDNFKYLWFAGAHSDVGGGYERHELADISLFWMAGEICSFVNLDLDFLRRSAQQAPDPWGTSQPHNAYEEQPIFESETRLALIAKDDQFHQSILQSPTVLDKPENMITLDTLREKFGEDWHPACPDLNDFEQQCKDNWGKTVRGIPDSSTAPIRFENPFDLFGPL